MSKSTGETVDPLQLAEDYGSDCFRYFLMREMTVGKDAEFSIERFESRYRADLGNDLGNLVSRLLHMCHSYLEGGVSEVGALGQPEEDLAELWLKSRDVALEHFQKHQFSLGLESVFNFIRSINKYADLRLPWKLAKSEDTDDRQMLKTCLATMVEALRLANALLYPVMPEIHALINDRLGINGSSNWTTDLIWDHRLTGSQLKEKIILFPRK